MKTVTLSEGTNRAAAELTALASICRASTNRLFVAKSDLAKQIVETMPMEYVLDEDDARVYSAALRTLKERTHDMEHSKALYAIIRVWLGGVDYKLHLVWRYYVGHDEPVMMYGATFHESKKEFEAISQEAKAKWEKDMESAYAEYLARTD